MRFVKIAKSNVKKSTSKNKSKNADFPIYLMNQDGTFILNSDGSKIIVGSVTFSNAKVCKHDPLNKSTNYPDGILLNNDGTPILNQDGSYIYVG